MIVIFNWRYADTLRSSYHDSNIQLEVCRYLEVYIATMIVNKYSIGGMQIP